MFHQGYARHPSMPDRQRGMWDELPAQSGLSAHLVVAQYHSPQSSQVTCNLDFSFRFKREEGGPTTKQCRARNVRGRTADLLGGKKQLWEEGSVPGIVPFMGRSGTRTWRILSISNRQSGTRRAGCGTSSGDLRSAASSNFEENRSFAAFSFTRRYLLAGITRSEFPRSRPPHDRETNSSILAEVF
jgi:hypothetical protein